MRNTAVRDSRQSKVLSLAQNRDFSSSSPCYTARDSRLSMSFLSSGLYPMNTETIKRVYQSRQRLDVAKLLVVHGKAILDCACCNVDLL